MVGCLPIAVLTLMKANYAGGSFSFLSFSSLSFLRCSRLILLYSSFGILLSLLFLFLAGDANGLYPSSITLSLGLLIESISTNSFSNSSINAYPNPGIMFVKYFSFCLNETLWHNYFDKARPAAYFNLYNINFDEDFKEVKDSVSLISFIGVDVKLYPPF